MAPKGGYRKIFGDEDKKVSLVSSLFYCQTRTLAVLSPTSFGKARNINAR